MVWGRCFEGKQLWLCTHQPESLIDVDCHQGTNKGHSNKTISCGARKKRSFQNPKRQSESWNRCSWSAELDNFVRLTNMGDPSRTSKAYLVENTVFIVSLIDTQFYSIMSSIHLSNFLWSVAVTCQKIIVIGGQNALFSAMMIGFQLSCLRLAIVCKVGV